MDLKIVFRLDFGPKIGWGHLSRALSISTALMSSGFHVIIATTSESHKHPLLTKLEDSDLLEVWKIPVPGHQNTRLASDEIQIADGIETVKLASRAQADIVLLDNYGLGAAWLTLVRASFPVGLVADFPAESEVDYLIDYGFDANVQKHHKGIGATTTTMFGSAYAPVNKLYSRFSLPPSENVSEVARVLVSLGAFGQKHLARNVLTAVSRTLPLAKIHVAGQPDTFPALQSEVSGDRFSIAQENGLEDLFATSDLSLVGAGVTMYELIASGSLGVVIKTAKNQEQGLKAAIRKGHVKGVCDPSEEMIVNAINDSMSWRDAKPSMRWLRSRSTVDHLGPFRIALKLDQQSNLNPHLREVTKADLPFLLRIANQATSKEGSSRFVEIGPREHWKWSQGFFNGSKFGWIFGTSEVPLGHCRIERIESRLFLSYAIQEEFHGSGWGAVMLNALLEEFRPGEPLFARVRSANISSLKTLRKLGFVALDQDGTLVTMFREP